MSRVRIGPTALLECVQCEGAWVDAEVFERLCGEREARAAVLHHETRAPGDRPGIATGSAPSPARRSRRAPAYGPCPACGKLMNRVNFGRLSGVVIDVCRGHGTFLDRGELHALATFISDGGLDRSRARQLSDLADERRRLESSQRQELQARPADSTSWDGTAVSELMLALLEMGNVNS